MDLDSGIVSFGNMERMKNLMRRAEKGGNFTLAYIGGSITQDCLATRHELCYAYLVSEWWKKNFPKSEFRYINAGIGATTSQFGVSRVSRDVLCCEPDFVVVEFSVNDRADDFFQETYEGLLRKILNSGSKPAVLVVNAVQYENGENAQEYHNEIAKAYGLPVCSMKDSLYREVQKGTFTSADITADNLHPNDRGHRLMADVIGNLLRKIKEAPESDVRPEVLPKFGLTPNRFENSWYFQNDNSFPELNGFVRDTDRQQTIRDVFKKGWTAGREGDSVTFTADCESFAVQYRKTIRQPAAAAAAYVDGNEAAAVMLDGSFDERWGDCPFITTVIKDMKKGKHTLTVKIIKTHEDDVLPFYLIGMIASSGACSVQAEI